MRSCPFCNSRASGDETNWMTYEDGKVKKVYYDCKTVLELEKKGIVWSGRWIKHCKPIENETPTNDEQAKRVWRG